MTNIPLINFGPVRVLAFGLVAVAVTTILLGLIVTAEDSHQFRASKSTTAPNAGWTRALGAPRNQNSLSALGGLNLQTRAEERIDTSEPGSVKRGANMLQFTSGGHIIGFEPGGVYVAAGSHALHVEFINSLKATPVSESSNKVLANRKAADTQKVEALSKVTYANLWPGVTLSYDAPGGALMRSSYRVEPNANADSIRLRYNTPVSVQPDGSLKLAFTSGEMTESAPRAWQERDGKRLPVQIAFSQRGEKEIAFTVGERDHSLPLFIDPTLTWNTFLGSGAVDTSFGVAVDGSGNVYVAGRSDATWGSPVRAYSSSSDAFAAKLDSSGNLTWNAFLGGSGNDYGYGVAVDGSGNVYVTGLSAATWGSPVRAFSSFSDAFAAKLNSSGGLTWNTFLGGSGSDEGDGVAVDGSGNVYVTGYSTATWGSPLRAYGGSFDAFAAKLDSSGNLAWNTFLGASGVEDFGQGVAVDGSGNVYVTGNSAATWGSPVRAFTGGYDAFVAKLNSSGNLTWNTFLGSGDSDVGRGIAVDGSGNVYVAGYSGATWGSPVRAYSSGLDAFAAKLNSSGNLTWNTFLGGSAGDLGRGVAVDVSGNVYVTGYSNATWGSPVRAYSSGSDALAVKLDSSGNLAWNTFLGGNATDEGYGVAVDVSGNVYVAGYSTATWGSPVRAYSNDYDSFVAKITSCSTPATPTITPSGSASFCVNGTLTSSSATGNQWYKDGNLLSGETNQTYLTTANGSYTVTVTDSGCTSASSAATVITINPNPATPTITPGGPTTFCQGGSVTLTSSSASGNQWYLNGNPIGATNQSYVATGSGNYTVTTTDGNGCASAPSAATTVTVNPLPATPTITPGGPTTFCQGGSVTLTSSSASGNQWYLNGNPIGGATTQTYASTASGNYAVTVTAGGCPSAPSAATAVTVNPTPPTPTITPGGPTTFCAGGSVTLTSSSGSGNHWYLNGNPIGGETNQNYVATGSGNYTVTIIDGNGCASAASAGTTVTVNPLPATPIITPGGPTTFCQGGSVTLTSSSASGNHWYLNGNPIGGETNQNYVATAGGNFTVSVTDGNGCMSAASAATTVTVNPLPATPTITPSGPTTFCAGGSVTLNSSSASGNQWYLNGNPIGGETNQTFVVTATGNYTVKSTDGNGCQSASSGATSVTVNPIPSTPAITPSGSTNTCDNLLLTSDSASGNQWYLNGNPIGGASNQTYTATASGNYTVVVTASGCSSAQSAATNVTVQQSTAAVTNTNDSGAGSLRDAIANVCAGGTINFDPALNGQTITLTSGELLIDKNLTIQGPGADQLTVMRSTAGSTPDFRIFAIIPGQTVGISGLTINNGKTTGDGAGINNQGALSLSNCAVTANQSDASGGGVSNDSGGTLVITASTISGNTGTAAGGGIANGGTLTLINSTISGNTGDGLSNGNIANLTNDTFSDNSVRGVTSNGGAATNVRNTIVANTPGAAADVNGAFNSQGNNLIGKSDSSNGFTAVNNDKIGTVGTPLNALLAALGHNGGPMQTQALLPGSPAINAANNCVTDVAHCGDANLPQLTNDQRGFGRQIDSTVDMGSFESRGFTIAITSGNLQSAAINTAFGAPLVATVSSATGEPVIGGQVVFTAPGAGAGATFTGGVVTTNASGQASASATANSTAGGPYTVSAAGNGINGTANFSLTNSKGSQTITFGPIANRTFGDPDFGVTATATSGLPVSLGATGNCTVTSPSPGSVLITGGGSCTITASQPGDLNYNPATSVPQSFTINKANQTITFVALANKTFGDADFGVSATSTSGLAVTVSLAATGNCTVTSSSPGTVHITGAGSCIITASQAGNANYNPAASVPQSFNIAKANQAINFSALVNKTFGDPDFNVSATAASALPVSLAASGNCTVTSLSPGTVHIAGAGPCTITASAAGDANYNPAANVLQSFTINKANQTINFGPLANRTFGDPDFGISATTASGLAVSLAESGNCTVTSLPAGTVHITGAGSCTVTASQAGDANYSSATNVPQSFNIAKAATSTAVASSVNSSDFGQSVTFTATVTSAAGTPTATVQFKDNGTNLGSAVALNATGVAQFTTPALSAATHTITAEYSGDPNFLLSSGTLSGGQEVKPQASLSINDVSIVEGDAGTKVLNFTVSLSAASSLTVTTNYATANSTATAPSDYTAIASTLLTFNPGDTTRQVSVTINGDLGFEPDETFFVNLSNPVNATISDNQGLGTIQNDDAQGGFISFGQASYNVSESTGIVTVTVTRTNDVSQATKVDYATEDTGSQTNCSLLNTGLASQRCDYTAIFGTLKFAANETQKTIDIPINLDAYNEGPETFTVKLSNPTSGAVLALPSTATVNISDSASPTPNAIDDTTTFVRQQYRDFLNRDADAAGLAFWKNNIDKCNDPAQRPAGQTLAQCIEIQRITTTAAFFLSIEFKQTGGMVRDFYVAALDRPLTNNTSNFVEFMRDTQAIQKGVTVGQGNWQQVLDANRLVFMNEFVTRSEFVALYPTTDTPTQYVDKLYLHANVTGTQQERLDAIADFGGAATAADTGARARALLRATQTGDFQARELNRSFVQMQYFGYLRRNPNDPPDSNFNGFNFWVNKLTQFNGNFLQAEMVKAFLSSSEYRGRFGP